MVTLNRYRRRVLFTQRNLLLLIAWVMCLPGTACSENPGARHPLLDSLVAPDSIRISLFAQNVASARHMVFDDQGILFLSQSKKGSVVALPDRNGDGKADRVHRILTDRRLPHGLAFAQIGKDYYLYVAEEDRVVRLRRQAKPFDYGPPETIVSGIPTGGHFTRTIKIKDDKLYLSVGSSCNVCEEDTPIRAAISRYDLDGTGGELFASGLRNTVGMEFSPFTGELWGVNNGRDWLGDEHPKEELNIIRDGQHYGWPYCYEDQVPDPDFGNKFSCNQTASPAHMFTAHMAPLGMAFYEKGNLPKHFRNSLFIAFHGSWNRTKPAGYKVVRVRLAEKGEIIDHEDFISGWLQPDGSVLGRPVDLEVSPKGDLYLSDDLSGVVYLIRKKP